MKNKIFIIIALVFFIGLYLMFSGTKNGTDLINISSSFEDPEGEETVEQNISPATPEEISTTTAIVPKQKHEVVYTTGGFNPAVTTVKTGEAVTFINTSGESFWPASSPHPTHTDYSEFDAKGEIAHGKTYEFTFTKSGEWGYHNHLNPKMVGVVVVE